MTKDEYIKILDSSFNNGTPFINFTEFYSYALVPLGGGKWLEVSYDFGDKAIIDKKEISAAGAFNRFAEEVEKGMSEGIDDFQLFKWKEYKTKLAGSDEEKLNAGIKELTANAANYSKNLPVVLNKDGITALKAKL